MSKSSKKSQEAVEVIDAIGKEGSKGRKYAKEFFDKKTKEEEKIKDEELNNLQTRKRFVDYNPLLADLLDKRLRYVDWTPGWKYKVAPTKEGVVMEIYSPDGRCFRAGFRPVRDPVYDLNAVEMYALRAENTMDRVMGNDKKEDKIVV